MKNYWLYYVGLVGVVTTVLVTVTSFTNVTIDLQIPFLLLGELLSLCVVGLGEIITIIKKERKMKKHNLKLQLRFLSSLIVLAIVFTVVPTSAASFDPQVGKILLH